MSQLVLQRIDDSPVSARFECAICGHGYGEGVAVTMCTDGTKMMLCDSHMPSYR